MGKVLVAYFSATGTTAHLAETLAQAIGDNRDFRPLHETHAHNHEDALGINRLTLSLDLHLGFELGSRLHEDGSRTGMDTSFVLNRQSCLRHNKSLLFFIEKYVYALPLIYCIQCANFIKGRKIYLFSSPTPHLQGGGEKSFFTIHPMFTRLCGCCWENLP